jgi:aryl-alcohol dehydrogenase-like predicted oxidoreductase
MRHGTSEFARFDTAEAYGESASRLRAWIDARGNAASVEIVTKCGVDSSGERGATLEASAEEALARSMALAELCS